MRGAERQPCPRQFDLDLGRAGRYIPTSRPKWRNGRRRGFKIPRWQHRESSSLSLGTTTAPTPVNPRGFAVLCPHRPGFRAEWLTCEWGGTFPPYLASNRTRLWPWVPVGRSMPRDRPALFPPGPYNPPKMRQAATPAPRAWERGVSVSILETTKHHARQTRANSLQKRGGTLRFCPETRHKRKQSRGQPAPEVPGLQD